MTKICSTPGCSTLTFGEICLGCMQEQAESQRNDPSTDARAQSVGDSPAAQAAITVTR